MVQTKRIKQTKENTNSPIIRFLDEPTSGNITNLIDNLNSVSTDSQTAKLNETSITDNNGGRITLGHENYIKK